MKVIKVGMAAFGMSGKVFHGQLIHAYPYLQLSVVHERSSENSKEKYPHVQVVKDYDALISDASLELIVVNTPQHLHYEMCKKALEAGKNVVVEKPFTVTTQEAQDLIRLAKDKKKILAVFQNRRWDGDFLTVQKVIKNNLLGRIVEYETHFDRFRNYIQEGSWKEEDSLPGAGLLYNLGPHMVDQAICLFGLPESVFADVRIMRAGGKVDDFFKLILFYEGLRVTISSSYLVREPNPRFILHGSSGSFIKYGYDPQEEALKYGLDPNDEFWGKDNPELWGTLNTEIDGLHFDGNIETIPGNYMSFYNNVYEAITSGKQLLVNPEDSMHNITIIEAAFESNNLKKQVPLNFNY